MEKLKQLGLDDDFGAYYNAEIVHRKEVNSARSDGIKEGESINKVMDYTGLKKKEIKMLM